MKGTRRWGPAQPGRRVGGRLPEEAVTTAISVQQRPIWDIKDLKDVK